MLKYYPEMRIPFRHGQGPKPNVYYHDAGHGEYYVGSTGITYSDPRIASEMRRAHNVKDMPVATPWLARDTEEVLALAQKNSTTVVRGDLGAGKSTVLYGVRGVLREAGVPYVMVNGHFLNRGPQIASAIGRAAKNGQVVIYDSFDYNYIRNGKQRGAKVVRPLVEEALDRHLDDGGTIIATAHTEPWFGHHSNDELTAQFETMLSGADAAEHRVHGIMDEPIGMEFVCTQLHGEQYGQAYTELAAISSEPTALTYRVAKLAGRVIDVAAMPGIDIESFDAVVQCIDAETREKMGAGPDYSLLPDAAVVI